MTLGVSMAKQLGKNIVACASTGNTSASMAVYAAKAGMPGVVLLPAGHVALGKVAQALMHGAKVISIRGNFDRALEMVHELCVSHGIYLLNSINPYRLEGQKTIGFEAVDQLGCVPDRFVLPVGNAGNISAVYKGLTEWKEIGYIDTLPKMTAIQAEGAYGIDGCSIGLPARVTRDGAKINENLKLDDWETAKLNAAAEFLTGLCRRV